MEGKLLGEVDGDPVGNEKVGVMEGGEVGSALGAVLGVHEGEVEGEDVSGELLGFVDGLAVGCTVGFEIEGGEVGMLEVGSCVGEQDGETLGGKEGAFVGQSKVLHSISSGSSCSCGHCCPPVSPL